MLEEEKFKADLYGEPRYHKALRHNMRWSTISHASGTRIAPKFQGYSQIPTL